MCPTTHGRETYMGRNTTRKIQQNPSKYAHHHFFMCVLNRCHLVGFVVAPGAALPAFVSLSELCSRSGFDIVDSRMMQDSKATASHLKARDGQACAAVRSRIVSTEESSSKMGRGFFLLLAIPHRSELSIAGPTSHGSAKQSLVCRDYLPLVSGSYESRKKR